MPTLTRRFATVLLLMTAMPGAATAAQGPAGVPDPARLPGRPGLPGAAAPGVPGSAAPTTTAPSAATVSDPATGAIAGIVTAADTGLPVRRARVTLQDSDAAGHFTLTDANGAFAFRDLRAGRYILSAGKTRYVDTAYGARRPGGPGRALQLVAGQVVDGVSLALSTAGVITGRVVDDAGEPVAGAQVVPMRYQPMPGGRRLVPAAQPRHTDDTGSYRLFGLRPGRYYVAARADEHMRFGAERVDASITGLAPTYHPSTPLVSEAQPILVTEGTELTADVALVATALTRIAGTVVDAGGRIPVGGFVSLMVDAGAGMMGGGGGGPIVKGGAFAISAVTPGSYILNVHAEFEQSETRDVARGRRADDPGYGLPITIGADGAADLRIVIPPLIEVPGRVVFEGGRMDRAERVMVMAHSSGPGMGGDYEEVGPDGRFMLRLRPGTWQFQIGAPGWMARRLEYRGRDIELGHSVELTAEPGARIDLTMTKQLTRLTGTVVNGSRQPVRDYRVLVFPRDEEVVQRTGTERMRFEGPGADGRFEVVALPPGDYLVVAAADLDPRDGFDPDMLDAWRDAATPVRIAHGEPQTITLTLAVP